MTGPRNKNSLSSKQLKERLLVCLNSSTMTEWRVEHKFHPHRKWRFDFYLESARLAVEVEGGIFKGGRHTNPAGFMKDVEKYNSATLFDIRVYRIPHQHLKSERQLLDHVGRIKLCAEMAQRGRSQA